MDKVFKLSLVFFVSALLAFSISSDVSAEDGPFDYASRNWGLFNTESHSHINALNAWTLQQGSKKVVVAVVVTGVQADHDWLSENMWHDPKNPKNYGWNFITDSPNPRDDHGHGTHIAGIIAAVARHVSIMSLKYYSDANSGPVNLRNTVKALNYAIDHGANIINYSGGGPVFAEDEYLALRRAESKGILVVVAAGNEHQNTDLPMNRYYPSNYGLSNMVSVASSDIHNNLLASSNWGIYSVDVAAPGENISSTLPGSRYGVMSGTSQATAFVSGIAALLLSQNCSLTPSELRKIILGSTDKIPQLARKVGSGGRVNAYAALIKAKQYTHRSLATVKGSCK